MLVTRAGSWFRALSFTLDPPRRGRPHDTERSLAEGALELLDPAAERFELPLEGGDRLGLRRVGFLGRVEVGDHEVEPLGARAHLADQVLARVSHRTGIRCSGSLARSLTATE